MPLVLGLALVLGGALLTASVRLVRGAQAGFALFDDERRSPYYCDVDVATLAASGPAAVTTPGGGHTPCLPRRLDDSAPGGRRGADEAFCAVLANAGGGEGEGACDFL